MYPSYCRRTSSRSNVVTSVVRPPPCASSATVAAIRFQHPPSAKAIATRAHRTHESRGGTHARSPSAGTGDPSRGRGRVPPGLSSPLGAGRGSSRPVPIEILVPTNRTLGGATRAVLETLLGSGFQNIDAPERAADRGGAHERGRRRVGEDGARRRVADGHRRGDQGEPRGRARAHHAAARVLPALPRLRRALAAPTTTRTSRTTRARARSSAARRSSSRARSARTS